MSSLLDWLVQNEPSFRKTRLPSLYSDLSVQKTSNPDGYAANVTAWQAALTSAALAGKLPTGSRLVLHTSDELLDALSSSQYGRPSGLGAVIDESVRNGKMIDTREFSMAERSIYSRSWVPSPSSILRWSLRQIGLAGSYDVSGRLKSGNLVLVHALEELSRKVWTEQALTGNSITDRVLSKDVVLQNLASMIGGTISREELDVLLRYMQRDKHMLSHDATTVKFKSRTSDYPDPITSQDHSIANLKFVITNLESQVAILNTRIGNLQSTAVSSVKVGNKHSALSAIRSKKLAEKNLQQRIDTLHQLEEVFTKIEQAADQVEVVHAMESGVEVLKGLNKQTGGVERVEDVVDRLREEMGRVDEVGQVMAEPLDAKSQLEEGEVDEEFEALEAEEKMRTEEVQAEKTRKRLNELERMDGERKQREQVKQQDVDAEAQVATSTERLRGMSIKDNLGNPDDAAREPSGIVEQA